MSAMNTNEKELEEVIERELVEFNGYIKGVPHDFDKVLGINTKMLFSFLEATQGKELARLSGHDWRERVPSVLAKIIEKRGTLYVLKNEQRIDNIKLTLFYPKPARENSAQDEKLYDKNIWGVTRQQTYSLVNGRLEIDAVIFLNGFPLFALELKDRWKGQTAVYDGIRQWKTDRKDSDPLLRFGRCLAFMTADREEVWMTSRLEAGKTRFIPFNKGQSDGAGNPPKPEGEEGLKTDYLWRDIFSPDTLSDIIMNFAMLDFGKERAGKRLIDKTLNSAKRLIFPRYHQLDAVRKLCAHAAKNGVGQRYLIQHSAGSGKSNTITWLAYKLADLYPAPGNTSAPKDAAKPLFDTVIVVTDRRVLDSQIASYIQAASGQQEIHAHADSAKDLKDLIEGGKRIVITTIEKFPYMCDDIAGMKKRSFAILIDEAHSSQSGDYSAGMNKALAKEDADEDCNGGDIDELVEKIVKEKKLSENASFFAFTATPKSETLEKFGTKGENAKPRPFHLYSMKQAIEEGFILDVTKKYTTYKSYYELAKKNEDICAEYDKFKAQAALKKRVNEDKEAIAQKAAIIMNHFDKEVIKKNLLKGQARAMVVTHDITCAIRYHAALKKLCRDRRLDYEPLIAFSGKKNVDGVEYTEDKINRFSETQTAQKFDSEDKFRILVVANKYITGFDQPKLCAMYVDKHLAGIQAVQTLSRLNRCAPELEKTALNISVLDFCNTAEDIEKAFSPYYTAISLARETDPNTLNDLMADILGAGMFTQEDLNAFAEKFYREQESTTFAGFIDRAANKFNESDLSKEQKSELKVKCKDFLRIYSRVFPIINYEVADWDKLFEFLRLLVQQMFVPDVSDDGIEDLLNNIKVIKRSTRKEKSEDTITLNVKEAELKPDTENKPKARSQESEKAPLDEILEEFNERYSDFWIASDEEKKEDMQKVAQKVSPEYNIRVKDNPDEYLAGRYFNALVSAVLSDVGHESLRSCYISGKNNGFRDAFNNVISHMIDAGVIDTKSRNTDERKYTCRH